MHPSGRFLYVTNVGSNDVSAYAINTANGTLSSIGPPVAARAGPNSIAVARSGSFAYVSNFGSNDVSVFAIDASGALTNIGATTPTGSGPVSVTAIAVSRQVPAVSGRAVVPSRQIE